MVSIEVNFPGSPAQWTITRIPDGRFGPLVRNTEPEYSPVESGFVAANRLARDCCRKG